MPDLKIPGFGLTADKVDVPPTEDAGGYFVDGILILSVSGTATKFARMSAPDGEDAILAASGADVGLYLSGDTIHFRSHDGVTVRGTWGPNGLTLNIGSVIAPSVVSGRSTVAVPNATVTTVATLPAGVGPAVYLVTITLAGNVATHSAFAMIAAGVSGATFSIITSSITSGAVITAVTVTNAGAVQINQNSGVSQTANVAFTRLS